MSAKKNLKNVIFDMGNVLLRYEPEIFIERAGVINQKDKELLLTNIFRSSDWLKLDSGEWDEKDLEEVVIKDLPEHLHEVSRKLIHNWHIPILPVEGMQALIQRCKNSGYKIYLLSNASRAQQKYWERVPGSDLFDGVVVSAFIGKTKPDPKIYEYILEKFNLKSDESLFIDDMERNTKAASKLGIDTFLFSGNVNELEQYIFDDK